MAPSKKEFIGVQIGEVRTASKKGLLRTSAIGSCIGITFYDPDTKTGGLAHIMLPGKAPEDASSGRTKYAENAIEQVLAEFSSMGISARHLKVVLAGAGNVLAKRNDTICKELLASVLETLKARKLRIEGQDTGGTDARALSLDLDTGRVCCEKNAGKMTLLSPGVTTGHEK